MENIVPDNNSPFRKKGDELRQKLDKKLSNDSDYLFNLRQIEEEIKDEYVYKYPKVDELFPKLQSLIKKFKNYSETKLSSDPEIQKEELSRISKELERIDNDANKLIIDMGENIDTIVFQKIIYYYENIKKIYTINNNLSVLPKDINGFEYHEN